MDLVDLAHLRYLSDYCKPAVLDYLYDQARLGRTPQEILGGVGAVLVEARGVEGALRRSPLLRRLRDRFAPWLRGEHARALTSGRQYRVVSGPLARGGTRSYHLHRDFEAALAEGGVHPGTPELIGLLAGYA
jgi:hypothetical protein